TMITSPGLRAKAGGLGDQVESTKASHGTRADPSCNSTIFRLGTQPESRSTTNAGISKAVEANFCPRNTGHSRIRSAMERRFGCMKRTVLLACSGKYESN